MTAATPVLRYATLVVGRCREDVWTINGTRVVGADALEHYFFQSVQPSLVQSSATIRQNWEEARTRAVSMLVVERADRSERKLRNEYVCTGAGQQTYGANEDGARSAAIASWEKQHPKPPPAVSFETWQFKSAGTSTKESLWRAELITSSGAEPVELGDTDWSWWHLPLLAVTRALESLAADGWLLRHVSEDQGLYQGTDTGSEAAPVVVRYLLECSG